MKKIICMVLAFTLAMALSVTAFADNDITTAGGTGSVPVTLSAVPAAFSVTVPTSFPVDVQSDGAIAYATNCMLFNNGNGSVKVTSVTVSGKNGWGLVAYNTDFSKMPTNTKKFGFKLVDSPVDATGTGVASDFPVINGNSMYTISYEANIAVQSTAITTAANIADVVFTIGWNT